MKIWGFQFYLVIRGMGYWWRYYNMEFTSPGIRSHALYFCKRFLIAWYTKRGK